MQLGERRHKRRTDIAAKFGNFNFTREEIKLDTPQNADVLMFEAVKNTVSRFSFSRRLALAI